MQHDRHDLQAGIANNYFQQMSYVMWILVPQSVADIRCARALCALLCADSIRDVTDSSVTKLQQILKSCIDNLDLQKIVKDIWRKAIDIDTWIKLDDEPDVQPTPGSTDRPLVARYNARVRRVVGLAFQVSDQYPHLCILLIWMFVVYMLAVAVAIVILQGWDTSW
jgi:hypothetical protein